MVIEKLKTPPTRRRRLHPNMEKLERKLAHWCHRQRTAGRPVTIPALRRKTEQTRCKSLLEPVKWKGKTMRLFDRWFARFLRRQGHRFVRISNVRSTEIEAVPVAMSQRILTLRSVSKPADTPAWHDPDDGGRFPVDCGQVPVSFALLPSRTWASADERRKA